VKKTETVFYCDRDTEPVAKTSTAKEEKCPECGNDMKEIGWFEYAPSHEG
jgi:anaerobic ribonucleoside-triphosphate reductase